MRKEQFIIYGTDTCNYCDKAKTLLDHYDKKWIFINIMESRDIQQAFFKKTRNKKTVPQVFLYDPRRTYGNETMEVLIGGYDQLDRFLKGK